MIKKIALGFGIVFGVAHIGLLGYVFNGSNVAQIPFPEAGEYSSYRITSGPDGSYTVEYIGNDPRVMTEEVQSQRGGFFGGNRTTTRNTQYTQDGIRNQGRKGGDIDEGKLSAQDIACIEAAGGGRTSGAIVGGSVAAAAAPALTPIPYVGWLAAGWATMLGSDVGGNIGAGVAQTIKGC